MEISLQIFKKNGGGFRTLSIVWDGSLNKIMDFDNENKDFIPLTTYYSSLTVHVNVYWVLHISLLVLLSVYFLNQLLWHSGRLPSGIWERGHWGRA